MNIREEPDVKALAEELVARLNALQDLVTHGQNISEVDKMLAATRAWAANIK